LFRDDSKTTTTCAGQRRLGMFVVGYYQETIFAREKIFCKAPVWLVFRGLRPG
jgi:hypothetical protein